MVNSDATAPWVEIRNALGELVLAASRMEQDVRQAVLNMLPGETWRRTELVIDGFSAAQMRERCERLVFEVTTGPLQDDAIAWLRDVQLAQVGRNAIVHANWADQIHLDGGVVIGPASTTRRLRKPKRGLIVEISDDQPAAILRASKQCTTAWMTGLEIIDELQSFSLREAQESLDLSPWTRGG